MDMFLQASRLKLRFDTPVGPISVEDLWDLPLTSTRKNTATLDDVAITLDQQIKSLGQTESFVKRTTRVNAELMLKFEIAKTVIDIRLAEQEAAATKAINDEKKQRILGLIAQKEDEELAGKSREELTALVNSLS